MHYVGYTDRASRIISSAVAFALQSERPVLRLDHLLLAVLKTSEDSARRVLGPLSSVDLPELRRIVLSSVEESLGPVRGDPLDLVYNDEASLVLALAAQLNEMEKTSREGDVTPDQLFAALVLVGERNRIFVQSLIEAGGTEDLLRSVVRKLSTAFVDGSERWWQAALAGRGGVGIDLRIASPRSTDPHEVVDGVVSLYKVLTRLHIAYGGSGLVIDGIETLAYETNRASDPVPA